MPSLDPILEALEAFHIQSVFIDARTVEDYTAGRIPGAVRAPVERWINEAASGDAPFADIAHWEVEIGALGIDGAAPALIYDDGRMVEAARVWFILQLFGVDARVINGGWPHLQGYPVEAGETHLRAPVHFAAKVRSVAGIADKANVQAELDEAGTRILDARTFAEHSGEDLRRNERGGHLPSARHLPHVDLLDEDGRLKSPINLHSLLQSAGFDHGDKIITHCDGGGRAALAAIAALRAGYGDVRAYYLSFADWAKDDACPVLSLEKI